MADKVMVKKLKIRGDRFFITLMASLDKKICEASLVYRNVIRPKEYPLKLEWEKDKTRMKLSGDLSDMKLETGDWDVLLKNEDGTQIPIILDSKTRIHLLLGNYEIKKNGFILFPMGSNNHMLSFRYREQSEYDGTVTAIKQNLAYICWFLLKPFWKKKRIWLIYEKFCQEAQENGFYFFEYCMEKLLPQERKHVFYIMDRKSEQWNKIEKYSKQIVPFMSFKHMLYLLAADIYIAPDAKYHSFMWQPKPNLITREISKKPILFLQHGVTALKQVDRIFGKKGSSPMTYYAVTSQVEQDIITENFGYKSEDVPILGFCRWDVLENRTHAKNKNILVMPTWRSWLEGQSEKVFQESDYCKQYKSLLMNQKLEAFLKENHVKLVFHIHPKMQEYLKAFQNENKNIEFVAQGTRQLNELIMESSMLITDYSSVSWDAYYLEKPILFYQFDYPLYMKAHGSYINMEKELFGDRCITEKELTEKIEEYVENDFKEKDVFAAMRKELFAYTDKNNCKRTLEFLKSRGY